MSDFKLLSDVLLEAFTKELSDQLLYSINEAGDTDIEVDYFDFYNAVSSVFSSKIEGEDIELDIFFKHKFLKVEFNPDYTARANDLFAAYLSMGVIVFFIVTLLIYLRAYWIRGEKSYGQAHVRIR